MILLSKYINLRCVVFPIYICDDNIIQLKRYKKIITDIIKTEGFCEMFVALATSDPLELIEKLDITTPRALYFLDIDLGPGVINGIELASRIRKLNAKAVIVMLTGYNFALETFQMKLGVKDYILKGDIKDMAQSIKACLSDIRCPDDLNDEGRTFLTINSNYSKVVMDVNEIYYIESVKGMQRKLNIHKKNGILNVSTTLKELASQETAVLFNCHKSYIININYIILYDKKRRQVTMANGITIPVSWSNVKKLEIAIQESKKKIDYFR